jgi:hypothetical protein
MGRVSAFQDESLVPERVSGAEEALYFPRKDRKSRQQLEAAAL